MRLPDEWKNIYTGPHCPRYTPKMYKQLEGRTISEQGSQSYFSREI